MLLTYFIPEVPTGCFWRWIPETNFLYGVWIKKDLPGQKANHRGLILGLMDHPYSTLKTLYLLVKDEPLPAGHCCSLDQLTERQRLPREVIGRHLQTLADEELIACSPGEARTVFLTQKGWEKMQSLDALTYL